MHQKSPFMGTQTIPRLTRKVVSNCHLTQMLVVVPTAGELKLWWSLKKKREAKQGLKIHEDDRGHCSGYAVFSPDGQLSHPQSPPMFLHSSPCLLCLQFSSYKQPPSCWISSMKRQGRGGERRQRRERKGHSSIYSRTAKFHTHPVPFKGIVTNRACNTED